MTTPARLGKAAAYEFLRPHQMEAIVALCHRSRNTRVSDRTTAAGAGQPNGDWEVVLKIPKVEAIPVSYPEPNDFDALRHLCLARIEAEKGERFIKAAVDVVVRIVADIKGEKL